MRVRCRPNSKSVRIQFFLFLWSISFPSITSNCDAQNIITVDSNVTHQTMIGWDVMSQAGLQADLIFEGNMQIYYPQYIDSLVSLLVNEAGVNMIRVDVRAGMEKDVDYYSNAIAAGDISVWINQPGGVYTPVNDNADPNSIDWNGFAALSELDSNFTQLVIPLKEKLEEARGESLFVYLTYADWKASAFEHRANPAEYAEFWEAIVQHVYNNYGFYIDAIDIINEPDNGNDPGWDNGIVVGNCAKAVIDRFQSRGWDISVIAPSTSSMGSADDFFDDVWGSLSSDDTSYFNFLSYHRYSEGNPVNLQNIETRVLAHPLINGLMNEWWANENNYDILHEDIKDGACGAWQQGIACATNLNAASPLYLVDTTQTPPLISIHDKTKYTMLYYRYIRSGAVRIEATTTNSIFDPLAFVNTDGKYVVVVKADQGGAFIIQGLPAGSYGIKYTTPLEYDIGLPDVTINGGEPLNASIPLEGIITVYQILNQSCTQGILGDVSGDDLVNSTDGLIVLSFDAGIQLSQPILDRINIGFGDVNEDMVANSTDGLINLSYDAGIQVPFPVGAPVCLPNTNRNSRGLTKTTAE